MSKKGSRQSLAELEALDDELDEFPIGLGCALDLFREKDEVFEIINSLPDIEEKESLIEGIYEKYRRIIDRYQEQPHLLDRHLEPMIQILLSQFRSNSRNKLQSLKFLRQLFKVRGPKEVVKRMPHEIADLVPVLVYLENEDLDDPSSWESGYVLVMWLSILVINPFHLKLLDGDEKRSNFTIAERLMKISKRCVVLNNSIGQAAPFLLSRFLTRPDMQLVYMEGFIEWACQCVQENAFTKQAGALAALSSIFKHAKRQEMLKYGEKVLNVILKFEFENHDTVLRKAGTKLIQRVGVMFMKTKIAPWRYQRGNRNLLCNLKGSTNLSENAGASLKNDEDYEELSLYSSAIESVLDKLLENLKDKDTVVRWSAAKGIGRVTNRLPKNYADEVVEGILQNFNAREGNGAWHGGCLALAELARRGLLLPERIPNVIPVVKKAMVYDEIRGNFSVGSHVRDAACYVLWAFARAFEPSIIGPFVQDIATSLVITMVFDREVNCRRAASAAFQENVGRQGNFPRGIDIVTVSDYFSVGIRSNAFTKVSLQIAELKLYNNAMIDHLIQLKFNHFDESVREITAEALGNLTIIEPNYIKQEIVPKLVKYCNDSDTYTSHGALLCLGSVLVKLYSVNELDFSEPVYESIREVIPSIMKKKFSMGFRGSELLRQGLNVLIDSCSVSKMPYHLNDEFIINCHSLLEDNMSHVNSATRNKAGSAFAHFILEYYYCNERKRDSIKEILEVQCSNLSSPVLVTRQGYAWGIGKFPIAILKQDFSNVIKSLLKCIDITPETLVWAESRNEALIALGNIFLNSIIVEGVDWEKGIPYEALDIGLIFPCLLNSMDDYTIDKRGDIGSWVRKSSITVLKILLIRLNECGKLSTLDPNITSKIMGMIAKQCVEKIDNVRVHAGQAFASLIHYNPSLKAIPDLSSIQKIFPQEFCVSANWRSTSQTFPKFVEMLSLKNYTYYLLEGFIISGGSLSDSVMKDANGAITNYLVAAGAMGDSELERIGSILLRIFENNVKNDRVSIPLMKFVTQLLQSGVLLHLLQINFGLELIELVKVELAKSSRVDKIIIGVELLCELLQGSAVIVKASLKRLTLYLAFTFPRVRIVTSQKMYEALLTYGAEEYAEQEKLERAMTLLSETQWDEDVGKVKLVRNEICVCLGVPVPCALR